MPKVGMRIIKSAVAVLIACIVSSMVGGGYPFYSAIAAILCMQKEKEKGWEVAKTRMLGTCIGGFCGYLSLLLLSIPLFANEIMQYVVLSVCIIPVMYITILLKKTNATYISCVVFLCVSITHRSDVAPEMFAMSRVLDTFIGIVVALLINHTMFTFKKKD